jgi:hypothetical protein
MPATDELLLKLIYQEENKQALANAQARLENMSEAEKKFMQYEAQDAKLLADEMNRLAKAQNTAADSSATATGGFSKMQAGLVTLQAGIGVAREAVEIFQKAWDFTKEGAAIQRISEQFKNVAASINTDSESLLAGLNKAAHGTVDDEALMQTATRAMALGIANNSRDLIGLMEIARASSVAFGGDTSAAFERISFAVENLTPRALKQSGIIVDLTKAYETYGKSIGKTADQLTDQEKRQALLNQVLEKGADLVKRIGAQGDDNATKIARFETKAKDLLDRIKEGAAGSFTPFLDNLTMIETYLDSNATQVDKLTAAYQVAVNAGIDPTSAAMVELKAAVEAAKAALADAINTTDASDRANRRLADSIASVAKAASLNAPTDLTTLTPEKQAAASKEYKSFQTKLSDIELKGVTEREKIVRDATDALAKLEADSGAKRADIIAKFSSDEANRLSDLQDKRIGIMLSYADQEQSITAQQNADRIKLAQNYGIEIERMEEAHQLNMARMGEDHGRNLRKLADSRDALAIEDEQQTYEINRRRAEEDYQIQARQKSEDYARQLADQNAAAEQQRAVARANEEKQLADLQASFVKQDARYQETYAKQLTDLDKSKTAEQATITRNELTKMADLNAAQATERAQANAQWTQWRNEHDIFFTGERKLYDDYLKYTYDQLQNYIKTGGGGAPTVSPVGTPTQRRASGGSVDPYGSYLVGEHGPERLTMGRQGGYVSPGLSAGMFNVSINVAGTNASAAEIKQAVYAGITEVIDKAMRQ